MLGEGPLLAAFDVQISSPAPLGREQIVSKVNCFLDCSLSHCESFPLGAIVERGNMVGRKPHIPEAAAGTQHINKPITRG